MISDSDQIGLAYTAIQQLKILRKQAVHPVGLLGSTAETLWLALK